MTESLCGYSGDRDDALIAFLYDDDTGQPAGRALFELHLETCARCRDEIAALRGVRAQLARWSPPEPSFAVAGRRSTIDSPQSPDVGPPSWWRDIPAWAQVAAALLFLGVSAGVANIDVRYDQNGLSVRTGWRKTPSPPGLPPLVSPAPIAPAAARRDGAAEPWRADLMALERQLKAELRAVQMSAAAHAQPVRTAAADADVLRRVRALLDESEKRQQRELALRVGEVVRDVNLQRQADLVKIDRTLGGVGVEVLRNRQKMNQMDILYRTSQRQ